MKTFKEMILSLLETIPPRYARYINRAAIEEELDKMSQDSLCEDFFAEYEFDSSDKRRSLNYACCVLAGCIKKGFIKLKNPKQAGIQAREMARAFARTVVPDTNPRFNREVQCIQQYLRGRSVNKVCVLLQAYDETYENFLAVAG